jgi:hypothetical protein
MTRLDNRRYRSSKVKAAANAAFLGEKGLGLFDCQALLQLGHKHRAQRAAIGR